MNTNRIQISEHFSLHEFQCRHCGQVKLHPSLLAKLQALRHQLGTPLVITPQHLNNEEIPFESHAFA